MKLLVLGDFHGTFPAKLKKLIQKEKIDLVVSTGDYMTFALRNIFFKHSYLSQRPIWAIVGKKKYKQMILYDCIAGERALKVLNALPVPVVTVTGNVDRTIWTEAFDANFYDKERKTWAWLKQDFFTPIIKKYKNIFCIDFNACTLGGYTFIGYPASNSPGDPTSKKYRKYKKMLTTLFKKHKKDTIIFVTHNAPYNTKLDIIKSKKAHFLAQGKHYGSKLSRAIIEQFHPLLNVVGHIHESIGIDTIGKTLVVNPGAAHEGRAAIITLPKTKKKKIKVKFY